MTEYPLFELLKQHPEPLSPMAYYLRDHGKPWEDVEARRKTELRQIFTDWKNGKHFILVLLSAFEATIGNDHEWSRMVPMVRNPDYFKGRNQPLRGETEVVKTPEEERTEYLAKTESVIKHLTEDVSPAWLTLASEHVKQINRFIDSLDTASSLEILISVVNTVIPSPDRYFGETTRSKLLGNLYNLRDLENRRASQHPNDKFIEPNLFDIILKDATKIDYAREWSQDEYLWQHEIELRRLTHITNVLEKWKSGRHPIHVLNELLQIGLGSDYANPYQDLARDIERALSDEKEARGDKINAKWTERERERHLIGAIAKKECLLYRVQDYMREMKPDVASYRGPITNPEFAKGIDAYIAHISETDENSLDIIRSLCETFLSPVDDMPGTEGYSPYGLQSDLSRMAAKLMDVKSTEDKKFANTKPMGPLTTQSEQETRELLKRIFNQRAKRAKKGLAPQLKLTKEIHIDASGSGAIKPYAPPQIYI